MNILYSTYLIYFAILFGLGYLFKRYIPNATWKSKAAYCLIAPVITMVLGAALIGVFADSGILIVTNAADILVTTIAVSWALYVIVYFTIRKKREGATSVREVWGLKTKRKD